MRPRFIMLDEPAGGLTTMETEHRICDRVTTLDLGKIIKRGTPDEVRKDPEVIRVYLGA
jgi:ABC-type branched-subunit amino acid transport system ATPase component